MTDQRRYDDHEVAEILELAAAEGGSRSLPAHVDHGMTLAELRAIGSEVGIEPERIDDAARAVAARASVDRRRTFLGAPRSVSRSVPIDRALTDDEWMRLVVDLRETFGAQGKIQTAGNLRSWTNGNLEVHVEPEGDRYRVRMRTFKGNISELGVLAGAFTGMGVLFTAIFISKGLEFGASKGMFLLVLAGLFATAGLGPLAWARARLPGWAGRRAEQMEGLAERIPLLLKD